MTINKTDVDSSKSVTNLGTGEALGTESDDTAVATVAINADGETVEITGVDTGTAKITVFILNSDNEVIETRTIDVTVQ
ncbi:hypothetical protein GCM10007425_03920 [Lysinibacillus alkalisoli]|uniref:Uncharacterized protein n=1 Tax=Lysinibacillus alkalisoli TaxID=1911548 RepID=A0A917FVQ6_9BACI|nr:hypothetical protein [Lysinibacillus alkalisoli]GGG12777.1 hypothetical protein GCM10007425_03920 [Lysinibacillus alkalisoli]